MNRQAVKPEERGQPGRAGVSGGTVAESRSVLVAAVRRLMVPFVRDSDDPEAVRRALINLVRNAIQASPPDEEVRVVSRRDGDSARLVVLDRGGGIDSERVPNLFDPFVSGTPTGTGLGLALVRRVAEEHDGEIRLSPREQGGTAAQLSLPVVVRGA